MRRWLIATDSFDSVARFASASIPAGAMAHSALVSSLVMIVCPSECDSPRLIVTEFVISAARAMYFQFPTQPVRYHHALESNKFWFRSIDHARNIMPG